MAEKQNLYSPAGDWKRIPVCTFFKNARLVFKGYSLGKEILSIALPAAMALTTDPIASLVDTRSSAKLMERRRRPNADYLDEVQRDVTATMRGILVDWYLSLNRVSKPYLQLLGVSSMLIASKYEEIEPRHMEEFSLITDNT